METIDAHIRASDPGAAAATAATGSPARGDHGVVERNDVTIGVLAEETAQAPAVPNRGSR